jgi:cyclic pyranopterin phosphate synthase
MGGQGMLHSNSVDRVVRSLPVVRDADPPPALVERPSARSVRLSITDRCDFACTYCRPSKQDGYSDKQLDLGAWRTLIDGLVASGVQRFRLTGGEPLLHPGIVDIVREIAARGVGDLALTTNASRLERLAVPLREAGLHRVNISIDSLDPVRFATITRGGRLDRVLRGIDAAIAAGLGPVKLNVVVLRGHNDDELEALTELAWERGMIPRFLELMPIAEGAKLVREQLVTVTEMRARLAHLLADGPLRVEPDRGPARYVSSRRDPALKVGFISGTSDTYCASCDRLRVSSSGTLRPCLATDDGVDASAAAEAGRADAIPQLLAEAWSLKPDGRTFKGCTESSAAGVSMRAIGG